jgi:hypothetical protein
MVKKTTEINSIELEFSSTAKLTPLESNKKIKKIVLKNVLVVGFSWICLFTAYSAIANLQSSLNTDGGLGTTSLSVIYVSLIFSSVFLPTTMIKKLGVKKVVFFFNAETK